MRRQRIVSHTAQRHYISPAETLRLEVKSLGHGRTSVELHTSQGRERIVLYKGSDADARVVAELVDRAILDQDIIDAQALLEEHREAEGVTSLNRGRVA